MTFRFGIACHAYVALLMVSGAAVSPVLAQDRTLAGQVVDGGGGGVSGATVFIARLAGVRPVAQANARLRASAAAGDAADRVLKTAPDGTFSALLPEGRYRIAVFKPGFEVSLVEVNLRTRELVEVRVRPAAAPTADPPEGPADRDRGLDWILRRSGGDELRDLEAGLQGTAGSALLASSRGDAGPSASGGMPVPRIQGELMQDFSGSELLGGEDSGPGVASGRSTRLALRGPLGEPGSWHFDALAGRTAAAPAGGSEARSGRRIADLGGGIQHRFGPGDGLTTDIRYVASRYVFDPGETADAVDQEQDSTAMGARWDRLLGDEALLHVTGFYREATLRQPIGDESSFESLRGDGEENDRPRDRSVGAAAGLVLRSESHEIGIGMRFHTYRHELGDGGALLSLAGPSGLPLEPRGQGRAMSLFGGDDWRVAERYVVNYGLGYHNDLASGSVYMVPRVGLTTTLPEAGDLVVRSVVMYRVEDGRVSAPILGVEDHRDIRPEGARLGYEIGVARGAEDRLQFAATLSYRPFQERLEDRKAARASTDLWQEEGVLVQSDEVSGRHEMEIEVQRGFGLVHGVLLGSVGRVRGRLSPVLDDGRLVEPMAGQARYYSTGLRATIKPTETEVRVDYRKVVSESEGGQTGGSGSLDYRRLDLAVLQDLPFSPFISARWRVLMAYQGLLLDSVDGATPWPGSGATSRVTGGVDISF